MVRNPFCRGTWPRAVLIGLTLAALAGACTAHSSPTALSLSEAARLALDNQPQVIAQQAGIDALHEEAVAARQLPDPRLVFGVEGLPTDSFSLTRQEMTQTVIGISQMIPGGDKLALASKRLEHQAARGAHALEAEQRRIAREARLAWLEAYAAEAGLALARDLVAEFERQEEWGRIAYQTGQVAQDETLAQRAMLASARNRVSALLGEQAKARAALARWVGEAGRAPLAPLPAPQTPPPLATLVAGLESHPEIRAAHTGLDAGRIDSDLARQAYKPDWSVDLSYGIRGAGRADTLKLMLGVDLPLFPEKRQDRRLAARLAELRQMEAMLEDRRRMLAADLARAHADWHSADARLKRLVDDILPLAARRIDSALTAYKTGRAGFERVLEARRSELETRQEQLDLEVARARAAIQLQYYQ